MPMRERGLQPKEFELTADRSARQAELYRSCGITVEGVRKIVRERMDKVEGKKRREILVRRVGG